MTSYIGLNVGGKIYRTSRTTLTREPDSFFSLLLSGRVPSERDERGNYLIDCDGKIFRHVLNCMRYGKLMLPDGFSEYELLRCQADYFQLESLKSQVDDAKTKKHTHVSDDVGLKVGGNIFHLTKEGLYAREPDCYFALLLREDSMIPTDGQGNFIIDKDLYENADQGILIEILRYLRCGDLYKLVTSINSHDRALHYQESALHYGLTALQEHLDSISAIGNNPYQGERIKVIMFSFKLGDLIIYSWSQFILKWASLLFSNTSEVYIPESYNAIYIAKSKLDESRFGSKKEHSVNGESLELSYPTTEEEVIEYIRCSTGAVRTIRTEQKVGCMKIEFL